MNKRNTPHPTRRARDARRRALPAKSPRSRVGLVGLLNAGISGLVPQGASGTGFLDTIRAVAGARRVLPGPTPGERRSTERNWLARLTPRERDVFAMVSRGLSRKDISRRLRISTGTVATHIRNILRKLMERESG